MHSYPAFPVFAWALVALFAKTTVTSLAQVIFRILSRRYLLPEDAALARTTTVESESPLVQRFARVWRNDTENLPLFLVLALSYVLLGAPVARAQILFGLYVVLRYLHTLIYLRGLQPWRTVLYLSGLLVCWMIAWQIMELI